MKFALNVPELGNDNFYWSKLVEVFLFKRSYANPASYLC